MFFRRTWFVIEESLEAQPYRVDFSLDSEIEDYCSFIFVLYFSLYSSFNFCSFMFVINMDLLELMVG